MQYYSTNNKQLRYSFRDAVLKGQAPDKGLFMPEKIPYLNRSFIQDIYKFSFHEIAFEIAQLFIENEIPENELRNIVTDSLNFEIPLVKVHDRIHSLELFHGPTCAFKDVGARFLARCMNYFLKDSKDQLNVLVATSGDTGSAVANGFYKVDGINVIILYPSNKISQLQEKQITTLGENITSLEIDGTFDDCQHLVKKAFDDVELNQKLKLTSANSINIARLIPQSFYYFNAVKQLIQNKEDIIISVPSGNFGNLSAGLMAKKMSLPVKKIIAATNINDIVPSYLKTNRFEPRTSQKTLSNAMDVGNPSNFYRIVDIYDKSYDAICEDVKGYCFNDNQTLETIKFVYEKYDYILDPHGAIGYAALTNYLQNNKGTGIFFETAHPGKFTEDVQKYLSIDIDIPDRLKACLNKKKVATKLSKKYEEFQEYLMNNGQK